MGNQINKEDFSPNSRIKLEAHIKSGDRLLAASYSENNIYMKENTKQDLFSSLRDDISRSISYKKKRKVHRQLQADAFKPTEDLPTCSSMQKLPQSNLPPLSYYLKEPKQKDILLEITKNSQSQSEISLNLSDSKSTSQSHMPRNLSDSQNMLQNSMSQDLSASRSTSQSHVSGDLSESQSMSQSHTSCDLSDNCNMISSEKEKSKSLNSNYKNFHSLGETTDSLASAFDASSLESSVSKSVSMLNETVENFSNISNSVELEKRGFETSNRKVRSVECSSLEYRNFKSGHLENEKVEHLTSTCERIWNSVKLKKEYTKNLFDGKSDNLSVSLKEKGLVETSGSFRNNHKTELNRNTAISKIKRFLFADADLTNEGIEVATDSIEIDAENNEFIEDYSNFNTDSLKCSKTEKLTTASKTTNAYPMEVVKPSSNIDSTVNEIELNVIKTEGGEDVEKLKNLDTNPDSDKTQSKHSLLVPEVTISDFDQSLDVSKGNSELMSMLIEEPLDKNETLKTVEGKNYDGRELRERSLENSFEKELDSDLDATILANVSMEKNKKTSGTTVKPEIIGRVGDKNLWSVPVGYSVHVTSENVPQPIIEAELADINEMLDSLHTIAKQFRILIRNFHNQTAATSSNSSSAYSSSASLNNDCVDDVDEICDSFYRLENRLMRFQNFVDYLTNKREISSAN